MVGESACNPSSVEGDHLSRMPVAWHLQRPTRGRGGPPHPPSCSVLLRVGFAKPTSRLAAGELLPHRFSLTCPRAGGLFSVALSLGSPPLGVTQHPALWSSDFPQVRPFGTAPAITQPAHRLAGKKRAPSSGRRAHYRTLGTPAQPPAFRGGGGACHTAHTGPDPHRPGAGSGCPGGG